MKSFHDTAGGARPCCEDPWPLVIADGLSSPRSVSAVGSGNIWGFPHGGGRAAAAFVVVHLLCIIADRPAIIVAEWDDRPSRPEEPDQHHGRARAQEQPQQAWVMVGISGTLAAFRILVLQRDRRLVAPISPTPQTRRLRGHGQGRGRALFGSMLASPSTLY